MLRLTGGGGGGSQPIVEQDKDYAGRNKTTVDRDADVRDLISAIVGSGEINNSPELAAKYQALRGKLGDGMAQKLFNHAIFYNQREGVKNLTPEARVQQFFDIGSSDAELKQLMTGLKSMGYGVVPSFREAPLQDSQRLTGRLKDETPVMDEETARKIMLKVAKRM